MTSRKTLRTALSSLLTSGIPAVQAVYAYPKLDLGGASPVITLSSGGSERAPMSFTGSRLTATLDLHLFVVQASSAWTEEHAENAMDDIEEAIYAVLTANRATSAWKHIDYGGRTDARRPLAMPGGVVYLHEIIEIQVQVY